MAQHIIPKAVMFNRWLLPISIYIPTCLIDAWVFECDCANHFRTLKSTCECGSLVIYLAPIIYHYYR